MAHELYRIHCFCEDVDQNTLRNSSMLKKEIAEEPVDVMEGLEANAFAGLLLMPSTTVKEQIEMLGIDVNHITIDDVIMLMDVFAIPYKACILRLYECGLISAKVKKLYGINNKVIQHRIALNGHAKRWQMNGSGMEIFGSLFDDLYFNIEHELLVESREQGNLAYITALKEIFNLDLEVL